MTARPCSSCWFDAATARGADAPWCPCCTAGHPGGHHDSCDHPDTCDWTAPPRSPTVRDAEAVLTALSRGVLPPGLTRDEALAVVHDTVPAPMVRTFEDHPDGTTVSLNGRTFTAATDHDGARWWVATPDVTPDVSVQASSRVLLAHLTTAVVEGPGTWADVVVAPPVVPGP